MYKEFFSLTRFPFHNTPDPAFFFDSRSHREALASMVYGVQEGKGFILVTGDVGAGKTMLVQALKRELDEQHVLIEIANPWVTPEEVLGAIRVRVDVVTPDDTALLDGLKARLIALAEEGKRVVLIIDEAHQIPERTLEGIRLLSNVETSTEKLLQIVLLGQDELASLLGRYSMRQVQQRIALNYHLQRFNNQETAEYIQHRLRVAGGTPLLFPADCIELIHQESLGSPRVINQLCDNCLLFAFGRRSPQVTTEIVADAIANLRPERSAPLAPGSSADASVAPNPSFAVAPEAARTVERATVSTAPAPAPTPPRAQPAAPEVALPFNLPGHGGDHSASPPPRASSGGIGFRHLIIALLIGSAVGALGLWSSQKPGTLPGLSNAVGSGQKAGSAPATSTEGNNRQLPPFGLPAPKPPTPLPKLMPPNAATTSPTMSYPVQPALGLPPLPGSSAAPLATREAIIPPQGGLSMLASSHYGTWNETVRDLIVAVNPDVVDLDALPAGSRVTLPTVTRENMVVRDTNGRFHVYFGSFDKAEPARLNLEAIRRSWSNAQLVPAERQGSPTQRLFVGVFSSLAEAQAVANSLWFKHLPVLN